MTRRNLPSALWWIFAAILGWKSKDGSTRKAEHEHGRR